MQQLSTSSTHKYTTRDKWRAVSPNDNDGWGGTDRTFTSVVGIPDEYARDTTAKENTKKNNKNL